MSDDHGNGAVFFKMGAIWLATFVGSITLSQIVLALTSVYTILQIWKLIREWRKERRREEFERSLSTTEKP